MSRRVLWEIAFIEDDNVRLDSLFPPVGCCSSPFIPFHPGHDSRGVRDGLLVPEESWERVEEVGGDTIENAPSQPTEKTPDDQVCNGHGVTDEEPGVPVVLEPCFQHPQPSGKDFGREISPKVSLLIWVFGSHGRTDLAGDLSRRVHQLITTSCLKVIVKGVESGDLAAESSDRYGLGQADTIHIEHGQLSVGQLASCLHAPEVFATGSVVLKGNVTDEESNPTWLGSPKGEIEVGESNCPAHLISLS